MKKILFILTFVLSVSLSFAQVETDSTKMTSKEKKEARKKEQFALTNYMLENKNFVLESDFLQDRYGNRIPVSSSINFVMINANEAVIQIGSNSGIGPNGVGGITAKGRITKWELKKNKKNKSSVLRVNVITSIGMYDLFFNIGPYGNATARLTGLRSGSLTFDGDLVPGELSGVYEGYSL
ncbi:MAG TPA: DUF4251 domain-containing protein [Draconibacterium sp.]|nr:DUF4251 domain-containing protein [Draconibacterium sp.]